MTGRVPVVDDILANVKLLEGRLSAECFDVLIAHFDAEALQILEAERIDAVLLDDMMPSMDGSRSAAASKPRRTMRAGRDATALDQTCN